MSRASDYIEKWNDAERLKPTFVYNKDVANVNFSAELMGDGSIVVTQAEPGGKFDFIRMNFQGAKEFTEWIWRIMKDT